MNVGYKVTVAPQHERKEYIAGQQDASRSAYTSYDVYEGSATSLPTIRLPLNLPIYRMANGRTQTQQLAYLEETGLPADYFSTGQEVESVQQIQHNILRQLADEGPDSITPISEELARTGQTEPILITPSGVVVNGNRRMAAMRELFVRSSGRITTFAHVECAVLPPLNDEQVDDVEIRLQMRPETKLPYGWINEALKVQKLVAIGRREEEIARLMRKRVIDVRKAITSLKYAEIYLRDWRKKPHDYRLVEAGEQFFGDLVARLKDKEGGLLEANMRMAWILFDNRRDLGSRIYDFNRVLGDKAAEVIEKLAERVDVDLIASEETEDTADDLDIDLGNSGNSGAVTYAPIVATFDDPDRREEIADELRAVCQTIIDAGKTAKEGRSALKAVQDANNRLTEVDLTGADPKTYAAITKQLDEILSRTAELKTKLQAYLTGKEPG